MPLTSNYLLLASMDVDPEHEAAFNEIYDKEHVPNLSKVPGIISIARLQRQELTMSIGGEKRNIRIESAPKYTAVYELESPEVLVSEAWDKAVELGRWPAQIRPYTKNRQHLLMKLMLPKK
ncbi:MAG: hypothetical protein ACE5HC_05905 [Candidatus Binatia bacterium]